MDDYLHDVDVCLMRVDVTIKVAKDELDALQKSMDNIKTGPLELCNTP